LSFGSISLTGILPANTRVAFFIGVNLQEFFFYLKKNKQLPQNVGVNTI